MEDQPLVHTHVHAGPCEGWEERYKMLTSENGRLLLTLRLWACSLSHHGGRSWLCSAGLSSMAHPGQLLQPPTPPLSTSHLQTLPQASWAILDKDFFHGYPT